MQIDFKVPNNADWWEAFNIDDGFALIDLTGADMKMDISFKGEPNLQLRLGDGLVITEPKRGGFAINVPRDRLLPLLIRRYDHDLLVTRSGKTERIWGGSLWIYNGVTR